MSPLLIRTVLCLVLVTGVAACSTGSEPDPERTGERTRAVELLVDFGLPQDQATCVVDRLGSDAVVATSDMGVLASGQPYQDAVGQCPS